ncbi:MAG: sigma-70 family RNA polymerase sigma factor [Planctomycetes bacterium]|nr:sigma-70 family RNA polymerase sigma factor [Planctomycetota bacterium]
MEQQTQKTSDDELTRALACGDPAALDQMVRRFCKPLTTFAFGKTGDIQGAEDIVQETFFRAYQNIDLFDNVYTLKKWLFTVAYRLIISEFRKKRPRPLSDNAAAQLEAAEPKQAEVEWIWQAARKLGPEAYMALWLRYKQEMKIKEIAEVTKKTASSVRALLHRTRKHLTRQLADKEKTNEPSQWTHRPTALKERVI